MDDSKRSLGFQPILSSRQKVFVEGTSIFGLGGGCKFVVLSCLASVFLAARKRLRKHRGHHGGDS